MTKNAARCQLCGEPMPEGEQMFKYHGYSGGCPKPPLSRKEQIEGQNRYDELMEKRQREIATENRLLIGAGVVALILVVCLALAQG